MSNVYTMLSSEQGKEFNHNSGASNLDNSYQHLGDLARSQQRVVQEGLQGRETGEDINKLRSELASNISTINQQYEKEVLHNSKLIDDFDKKVNSQRKQLVDALKVSSYRGDDLEMKSLQGRAEDSTTFMRFGNSRYIVFAILAIVFLAFTFTHANLNTTGYFIVSIILGGIFIFIVNYIHQIDIRSN